MDAQYKKYTVGDTIRIKHYPTAIGYRVWKVVGVHLGAADQEGTYALTPLDIGENEQIHVPCLMMESHDGIERV